MSYGDGSITFEYGKHRVRIPDGKGGHESIGAYDTEDEAIVMRNAALLERRKLGSGQSFRAVGELWFAHIKHQRNLRSWRTTWEVAVLTAAFADLAIECITRLDINDWVKLLPNKRASRSVLRNGVRTRIELGHAISEQTQRHALGLLRRCFQYALREGMISEDPTVGVTLPKRVDESDDDAPCTTAEISYLEDGEIDTLLGFKELPLEQFTVFTISTHQGLREGEIAGLDWERFGWDEHGWTIARSWNGKTKNKKARWQAWLPRAEAALRAWWEHRGRPSSGIVFPSPRLDDRGRMRRYGKGFDWGWADHPEAKVTRLGWWRRAGLTTRVRLHDHRDTAATHLLSGTWGPAWTIEMVSDFLGHSSIEVTRARYAHITQAAARRAAAQTLKTPAGHLPDPSRPATAPTPPESSRARAWNHVVLSAALAVALPGGIEPPTVGLGSLRSRKNSDDLQPSRQVTGRFGERAKNLAFAVLERATADEAVERAQAVELADAVLADPVASIVALAHAVKAGGGPHTFDRVIDLAVAIVAAAQAAERSEAAS